MTKHQKAFAQWLNDFKESCKAHGSIAAEDWQGCWFAVFKTPVGDLRASIHESDYDGQMKRGFVQIYLRFKDYDTGKCYDTLGGFDFNGYSGKWNITLSGGKEDVERTRQCALAEFERRLNFAKQLQPITTTTPCQPS